MRFPWSKEVRHVPDGADREFTRRSELSSKDPAQFDIEFTAWLARHPEWHGADRVEQLAAWLRATD